MVACNGLLGGALQANNIHSSEWAQVRSSNSKDEKEKKISKLLGTWETDPRCKVDKKP
jgi:hypothetical protein